MKLFFISIFFCLFTAYSALDAVNSHYDVTVIGEMQFSESLARFPIILIDTFKDNLKVNFIRTRCAYGLNYDDIPLRVRKIAQNPDKTPGKVALFCDLLWIPRVFPAYTVPQESPIKIAYSMFESTEIPQQWVTILNHSFDAVVVPDKFLVPVYKRSGVKIPIFVIPYSLYLDEFLEQPLKDKKNELFTFGVSGTFYPRKNLESLVRAFIREFGNNAQVQLRVHARRKDESEIESSLENLIKVAGCPNIQLIKKRFNRKEYFSFLSSLDCYVFISKGEGFSITPREALALGIPCILSKNTAHTTICDTGLVRAVPSLIMEPAYYSEFKKHIGYYFNCKINDVREAMRDVYSNYEHYLSKAVVGRKWVKRYCYRNLKNTFITLVKPKNVILGTCNKIKGNDIITTSSTLYNKYHTYVLQKEEDSKE